MKISCNRYKIGKTLWSAEVRALPRYAAEAVPLTLYQVERLQVIQTNFARYIFDHSSNHFVMGSSTGCNRLAYYLRNHSFAQADILGKTEAQRW